MTNTTPRNAQQANEQAKRYQRAKQLIKEGYTFHKDAETGVIAVCKPGRLAASYWINVLEPGCDCPDAMKGNNCKHEMAWQMIEAEEEARAEAESLEFQCELYDNAECASGVDYLL